MDPDGIIKSGWWLSHPLKNMNSSVGMMKFPIYGKMFQTTNQYMITTDNDISDNMSSDI